MKIRTSFYLVGVLLLAGIIFACASSGGKVAPIGNASGTATGSAFGFGGDVTVTITMENGYIVDVVCKGDGESPTIGGLALMRTPDSIKKANSADIDTITGATITTIAVKEAAQKAIDEIAGK